MMDGWMMNGWMGWFWTVPVLVLIGLTLLGYIAYQLTQLRWTGPSAGAAARRMLDERYARGEIDDLEYRHRRTELKDRS